MLNKQSRGFTPPPIFTNISSSFRCFFSLNQHGCNGGLRKRLVGGFTMLEILIVVAILAIILASVLPSLLNFRRSSVLNTETQEVVTLVNRARMLAVSSKNDDQFGVHFETGKIVLFQGTTYTAGAGTNEEHNFDPILTTATSIYGGGADVLFAKVTGSANKIATTTLLVTGTTASTTVVIRRTGVVTIN